MPRFNRHVWIGIASALLLGGFSWLQALRSSRDLPGGILRTGRIVLSSPLWPVPLRDRPRLGRGLLVVDRDPETATVLRFEPARTAAFLLVDVGLSHDPPRQRPRARRPYLVQIFAGPCTSCIRHAFRSYGRPRRMRLELYGRQANNPDREFRHEPPLLLREWSTELEDRPGPQPVLIPHVPVLPSEGYPQNVKYLSLKIIVETVYPGERFPETVAFAEVVYADVDAAVSPTPDVPRVRYWR